MGDAYSKGRFGVVRKKCERGRSGRAFLQKYTQGEKERRLRQGELSEPSRWIASVLSCSPEVRRCVKEICAQSPARNREKWTRVKRGQGLEAYELAEGVVAFVCRVVIAPNGVGEVFFLSQKLTVVINLKVLVNRKGAHYRLSVELNFLKTGRDIDFHT